MDSTTSRRAHLASDFDVRAVSGLSEAQAAERLKAEGPNEIPGARRHGALTIVLAVAAEPMFVLLVACGVIYLALGHLQDALMLLSFVVVVMGITAFQERKTERALEALRDMSSPRAMVIRDGGQRRIPGREVVRGDVVVLSEGDRVPADASLLWSTNLLVDESLLTGESVPVRKAVCAAPPEGGRPGGDDQPFVYSGTLVVGGQGVAEVLAIGARTELGKIGRAIQTLEPEKTALQKETARLVRVVAAFGILLCAAVAVLYGVTTRDWLQSLLRGLTLAMSMLPEEVPVVLTVFLAIGAWRMAKKNVLTRRLPAVEALGAATVLCVDKTGTLTLNRMSVGTLGVRGQFYDLRDRPKGPLPEAFHETVEFAILASQRDPFDPMERALRQLGDLHLARTEHIHDNWRLVREYPLSPGLLALSHVWESPDRAEYVIAAKGGPEAIADLCHLSEADLEELSRSVNLMASEGLRVLGVAKAHFRQVALPGRQHDFRFEFLGLVGLYDPVRPGVARAIQECDEAGIRVIMVTGDYPETARNVAGLIGLAPDGEIVTGPELESMDEAVLRERIRTVSIFARTAPQQKLRLVEALKANGEVVAMTGDGVNDAPALKAADIGVAMGARGTDVAREASAIVLVDDNFCSIVEGVRTGRRIMDNLRRAVAYVIAIHVPIAGLSLLPLLLKLPIRDLLLMPIHIVFLELIIDPACSIVFEAELEEADAMKRPPREPGERLFGRRLMGLSLLQGMGVLAIMMAVLTVALGLGRGELEARTLTFTALIVANLGLILANRSWSRTIVETLRLPNPALWWVFGGALAFLGLVLYVPFLRRLFHFATLHPVDLAICLAAGVTGVVWFEVLKFASRRRYRGVP